MYYQENPTAHEQLQDREQPMAQNLQLYRLYISWTR